MFFFLLCHIRGSNSYIIGDNSDKVIVRKERVMNLPLLSCSIKTSPVTQFFSFLYQIVRVVFSYFIRNLYVVTFLSHTNLTFCTTCSVTTGIVYANVYACRLMNRT